MNKNTAIGIAGAGTMGTGLAQLAATYDHKVFLHDADSDQLQASRDSLRRIFDRQVEKGRMSGEEAARSFGKIEFNADLAGFEPCGLIVEAITEDPGAKKQLLRDLEKSASEECVIATNTSSLLVTSLASALKKPGRFLGMHFFNPVPLMKLVEIIAGLSTDDAVADRAEHLVKAWGKHPVRAKDTPGFIVNRIARPFYGEALRILEEGIAGVAAIDRAVKEQGGFRMGPFELMDLIGIDVNYQVSLNVFSGFYYDPRFRPSFLQKKMVETGWLGRKTGRGFYNYTNGSKQPGQEEEPEIEIEKELGEQIMNRILAMLINEACDAVFMNIASVEDIDAAMVYGGNYPRGLLKWSEELGLSRVLDTLNRLREEFGEEQYRPNPLMKQMVREGKTFYEN